MKNTAEKDREEKQVKLINHNLIKKELGGKKNKELTKPKTSIIATTKQYSIQEKIS